MGELGLMCMIALDEATELEPILLKNAVQYIAPKSSVLIETGSSGPGEDGLLVTVDRHRFVVAALDGEVPQENVDGALQNNIFWPEGRDEFAGHRGMLAIAALEQETSHGLVRAQAIALTKLAAAMAEIAPSRGVYWRGSETVCAPERLLRAVNDIDQGKWPVDLWIGYIFFGVDRPDEPLWIGCQSRGAFDYLGFEIEVPPFFVERRSEPIRILLGAVGYLMNFGDVIRSGQLVQVDDERRTQYQLHIGARGKPGLAQLSVVEDQQRQAR